MNFNWHSYLTLAEYMCNNIDMFPESEKEAVFRSVVSRAYYAVFCMARDYIENNEEIDFGKRSNIHQKVQNYFLLNHSNEIRRKIGKKLKTLRQERNKADYDNKLDELPIYKASKAIVLANKIIESLETIGLKSRK